MPTKTARATAKLKLNGVNQVCQTCQADVNMQPAGQKCQLKHGRDTNGVSHVYQTCQADAKRPPEGQKFHPSMSLSLHPSEICMSLSLSPYLSIDRSIYLSIYLSNLPGRREHATCRSKMPAKTRQGHEWRKPCISNMPSRRPKRPPEGQKRPKISSIYVSISPSIGDMYVSLPISLSIYRSIYLSICQTCQADVNMQPAGQKCQLKHGRDTNGVSHVYQTCQADAKKGHLKAKNASKNMTGRRKLSI